MGPTISQWPLATVLIIACVGWGQPAGGQTNNPPISSSPPEQLYVTCQEAWAARRNLPRLQPLFPHLGAAVLEVIKEFEQRPQGATGEWAEPLRQGHRLFDHCLGPIDHAEVRARARMSEDELALRSGGMQRRLIGLALTGRVTKREFDGLVNRLQGN